MCRRDQLTRKTGYQGIQREIFDGRMDEYAIMHGAIDKELCDARHEARREARCEACRDADIRHPERLEARYARGENIFSEMQRAYANVSSFLLERDRRRLAREAEAVAAREAREALEERQIDCESESILDPNVFP